MITFKAAQDPNISSEQLTSRPFVRTKYFGRAWLTALVTVLATFAFSAPPAFAESHPQIGEFSTSSNPNANPNGIAIDESTGDVYVADIATNTVYKFDAVGDLVDFSAVGLGATNELTGSGTPATAFSFPNVPGTPAAIAVDNSKTPSDPSVGDLYVMDAGHGVIDKFSPNGEYLSQISGFAPATGSSLNELLGLAVDANGTVRVELKFGDQVKEKPDVAVDEFDDSSANHLVAKQVLTTPAEHAQGVPPGPQAHGFAVGPTGDDYLLYESCSCSAKFGPQLAPFGAVEASTAPAGDVAVAVDPASGHLYVDDQSSVAEWDTGAMNGDKPIPNTQYGENETSAAIVSRFDSPQLSGTSGQGGIAVNGASGDIYVSNPADGKVYVFGSDAPAVTAGSPASVTKTAATLNGTVDPRDSTIASCQFEYGVADEYGQVTNGSYEHKLSCTPQAAEIGAGSSPVTVSARIEGLQAGLLYRFRLIAANTSGSSESSGLIATPGEGFGINKFAVSFLNEDGSPDTQAGSHPYQMVTNFELNSHFIRTESNADSPYVQEPEGTLKNLAVDLPPGWPATPTRRPGSAR